MNWEANQTTQWLKIKNGKQNGKILSLVSGSNRDGISKPNTATQLTVITIINWNSKVDPQNKVNQEGLPQLKKYFNSFI